MKPRLLQLVLLCTCLTGGIALAQGRGPGGPPPGGGAPGGRGPGGPGGPPAPANNNSGATNGNARNSTAQFGPVGRWWDTKSAAQTVGLSRQQQKKMDVIFNANKPAIVQTYKILLAEQAKLDKLTKDPNVDKSQMFAAIDAVNQAHSALEKATTQMLLQIRQEMDADQLQRLEKLQ
jgi:hypothetical protein